MLIISDFFLQETSTQMYLYNTIIKKFCCMIVTAILLWISVPITTVLSQLFSAFAEICTLSRETGFCRAAITRWYYDNARKECTTFIWGGCGGNGNRFESKAQCESQCQGKLRKIYELPQFKTHSVFIDTIIAGLLN